VDKDAKIVTNYKLIDLHVHSNISDGTYSPSEVVKLAADRGVGVMALTDHDTVEGVVEAEADAKEQWHLRCKNLDDIINRG
jgi:predicted metal-dependent phosphoesterase TrpH